MRLAVLCGVMGALVSVAAFAGSAGSGSSPPTASTASLPNGPVARGVVRPVHQASIAVDLPVRVARVYFREAEAFRKGDTLITFDCERLVAEHAAAKAVHREATLGLESQSYLDRRGAVGKLDVEISRTRVDKTRAEAEALGARLKHCRIVAPFDGRITELKINEHEMLASNQPLMSIVAERAFEIDLIVPSLWLRTLEAGTPFAFLVDETGQTYDAKVLRVGAAVDPVSQTVKVIAGFAAPDSRVLAGMSGSAQFGVQEPRR